MHHYLNSKFLRKHCTIVFRESQWFLMHFIRKVLVYPLGFWQRKMFSTFYIMVSAQFQSNFATIQAFEIAYLWKIASLCYTDKVAQFREHYEYHSKSSFLSFYEKFMPAFRCTKGQLLLSIRLLVCLWLGKTYAITK